MAKDDPDRDAFFTNILSNFPKAAQGRGFAQIMPGMLIGTNKDGEQGFVLDDKFIPLSKFKMSGGGAPAQDDGGGSGSGSRIKDEDVDFGMRRRSASLSDAYRPKVTPTMKEGGLVRGAGKAQRGRGRGKMV